MESKKRKNIKVFIIILLLLAIVGGGLLAKVAPMKAGTRFLNQLNNSIEMDSTDSLTTKITTAETTTSEVKIQTYDELVNEELNAGKLDGHLEIPLQLQTDEKWEKIEYGIGNPDGNTIGINGCAITSLAMVTTFLDGKNTTPQDILNWAKNDYYLEGEGTTWSIFPAFAEMKGYQCEELGMDIVAVEEQLKKHHPVIISVKPGYFTETGHIMVVAGMKDGKFWVNDPNDSESKGHSKKTFSAEELMNEAMNFWTIYK